MSKTIIMADSTCDLSEKLIKENDIKIFPLYVVFGDDAYKDGVEIDPGKLYKMVEKRNELPKTSAASVGDLVEFFKRYIEEGHNIIFIAVGSGMSSTYNNALLASKEFPEGRIEVIDGQNLSTGTGLLVLKAAKYAREGWPISEVAEKVRKLVPNVRSKFTVESLDYLHKGGRCSGTTKLIGNLFRIKPVIEVKDNKLGVLAKPIGKKRALKFMIDDILENKEHIHTDCIMVTHTFADGDAKDIKKALKKELPNVRIEETEAGCVISSHCGKGTIGILYIVK